MGGEGALAKQDSRLHINYALHVLITLISESFLCNSYQLKCPLIGSKQREIGWGEGPVLVSVNHKMKGKFLSVVTTFLLFPLGKTRLKVIFWHVSDATSWNAKVAFPVSFFVAIFWCYSFFQLAEVNNHLHRAIHILGARIRPNVLPKKWRFPY